jgi:hypothetical protein
MSASRSRPKFPDAEDVRITHVVRPERLQEMYEGLLHRKDEFLKVVTDWRIP